MAAFQAQGGLSTFINRLEVREGQGLFNILFPYASFEMNIFHDSSYIKYERGELYQKKRKTKKPFIFYMLIQNRNVNIDIFFFFRYISMKWMCVGKSSRLRSRPRGESRCWRRARCPRPLTWRRSQQRLPHQELQPPLGQQTPTSPPHPQGSHTTS